MLGVLITLVFATAIAGFGKLLIGRWLKPFDPAFRCGAAGLVGLGAVGTLTLFIGLLPGGLRWGIALPALAALVGFVLILRDAKGRPFKLATPKGPMALLLLALVLAFLIALVGVLAPSDTLDWDSLAYHLAVPKIWLAAGQVTFISFIHHSNFPFAIDNLFVWGLVWGGQSGAKAFSLAFWLYGVMAIFGLARQRVSDPAGWWAAAAFGLLPVVVWLSGTAYIDVGNGLYAGLGIVMAAWWLAERERREALVLAGVFLGLAAGSKYTGLQTIFAVGVVLVVAGARGGFGGAFKSAVVVSALALAIASPWYVKNVVNTGNPVYPFFYSILGGKNWDSFSAQIYSEEQQTFGAGRAMASTQQPNYAANPLEFSRLPSAVLGLAYQPGRYINPAPTQGFGVPIGTIGFAMVATGLLWLISGRTRVFEGAMLGAVGISLLLWFVLSQQVRYMITLAVPLSVLAGMGAVRLKVGPILAGAVAVQALLSLFVLTRYAPDGQNPRLAAQLKAATGQIPEEEYLGRSVSFYRPAQFLNEVAKGGKVALYDEVFGYFLDVPYFWANPGHTTELGYDQMESGADLVAAWRKLGITHVYLNMAIAGPDDPTTVRMRAAMGLDGPPQPYAGEEREQMFADLRTKWKVLVAEAVALGELELLSEPGRRLIFKLR